MEKKTDTSENGEPGSVEDGAAFHQADLDRVQRKLSRSHVQMCVSHQPNDLQYLTHNGILGLR